MKKTQWEIDLFNQYKAALAAAKFVEWVQANKNIKPAEYKRRFAALPTQAQFALQQAVRDRIDNDGADAVGLNGRPMFEMMD
jgi:hypothetical protein